MDNLVKHIHDDHIGSRKAKYACEWDDCSRKGLTHASGYALRAHMRSHTREKPFYCTLPGICAFFTLRIARLQDLTSSVVECDRSFTRSDALAKHMRTVHETEALRPSDPVPKSHQSHPQNIANTAYADALFRRQSKAIGSGGANGDGSFRVMQLATPTTPPLSLFPASANVLFSTRNSHHNTGNACQDSDSEMENGSPDLRKSYYSASGPYSPDETHRPPRELYHYLKQKLKWVQLAHEDLQKELEVFTNRRREAWVKKELLLERCLQMELGDDMAAVSIFGDKGIKSRGEDVEMKDAMEDEEEEDGDGGKEDEDGEGFERALSGSGVFGRSRIDARGDAEDHEVEEDVNPEGEDEYATEEE